jgi:hypothetical protein
MAFLAEELIEAYPEALILLNTRPVEKWLASMDNTAVTVLEWRQWPILSLLDPMIHAWFGFAIFFLKVMGLDPKRFYLGHYEAVRRAAPKERLLEWNPKDGWAPICERLGIEPPKEPFPHVNEGGDFVKYHVDLAKTAWGRVGFKMLTRGLPVVAGGLGVWMWYANKF